LLKCCGPSAAKFAEQLELELTDTHFKMSVVGVAGWKRTFSFNVLEGDDITSNVDPTSEIEPFLRCPVSVIEAECGTFPRGITEVSLWIDNNRLNLKSYTDCEGILKNTVRSEVSIPVSDVEVSDCLEGALTFSLRELLATVELWGELSSPDQKIELFNHEVGKPVIATIDADYIQSTFVTSTLNIEDDLILERQISQQSFLIETASQKNPPPQPTKKRRSDTTDNRKVKRPKKKSPPPPPRPQWSQNENEPPPMINHERQIDQNSRNAKKKEADFLLFGGDSDDSEDDPWASKEPSLLGPKPGCTDGRSLLGLDTIIDESQSQKKKPVQILCYDSE